MTKYRMMFIGALFAILLFLALSNARGVDVVPKFVGNASTDSVYVSFTVVDTNSVLATPDSVNIIKVGQDLARLDSVLINSARLKEVKPGCYRAAFRGSDGAGALGSYMIYVNARVDGAWRGAVGIGYEVIGDNMRTYMANLDATISSRASQDSVTKLLDSVVVSGEAFASLQDIIGVGTFDSAGMQTHYEIYFVPSSELVDTFEKGAAAAIDSKFTFDNDSVLAYGSMSCDVDSASIVRWVNFATWGLYQEEDSSTASERVVSGGGSGDSNTTDGIVLGCSMAIAMMLVDSTELAEIIAEKQDTILIKLEHLGLADSAGTGDTTGTAASVYAHFTYGTNEDAFKADVSSLALEASLGTMQDTVLKKLEHLGLADSSGGESVWTTAQRDSALNGITAIRDTAQYLVTADVSDLALEASVGGVQDTVNEIAANYYVLAASISAVQDSVNIVVDSVHSQDWAAVGSGADSAATIRWVARAVWGLAGEEDSSSVSERYVEVDKVTLVDSSAAGIHNIHAEVVNIDGWNPSTANLARDATKADYRASVSGLALETSVGEVLDTLNARLFTSAESDTLLARISRLTTRSLYWAGNNCEVDYIYYDSLQLVDTCSAVILRTIYFEYDNDTLSTIRFRSW